MYAIRSYYGIEKIVEEKNGLATSYGEDIFVATFKSTEDYEEALRT